MEGAHTHLLLNHFPVIGSILSSLILIAGFMLKNDSVKKTALALIVFTTILTIPAFLSGEDAEGALKAIGQAPKKMIHAHEELAEKGLWSMIAVGIVALISFLTFKKSIGKKLVIVTLLMIVANSLFFAEIGNLGGVIRHTEIRPATSNTVIDTDSTDAD